LKIKPSLTAFNKAPILIRIGPFFVVGLKLGDMRGISDD
jgi:hypothetical protein